MHREGISQGGNGAAGSLLEPPPAAAGPEEAWAAFVAALNDGRLREATACFIREACLITPDSTAVHGREEIRPLLAQLIDRETRVEVGLSSELRAGDVVLSRQRWTVRSHGADGHPYTQDLSATLVLHRLEGSWKIAVAAPWS